MDIKKYQIPGIPSTINHWRFFKRKNNRPHICYDKLKEKCDSGNNCYYFSHPNLLCSEFTGFYKKYDDKSWDYSIANYCDQCWKIWVQKPALKLLSYSKRESSSNIALWSETPILTSSNLCCNSSCKIIKRTTYFIFSIFPKHKYCKDCFLKVIYHSPISKCRACNYNEDEETSD